MKKLVALPNLLKLAGAVLGLVAFFMMFTNQVYAELLGNRAFVEFDDALFGENGAAISFVGYLLLLLGALGLCAMAVLKVDKKMRKYVTLGLAGLLLLGAIFVLIEAAVLNGDSSVYHLAAGPVFAGIFGILAALLGCASEFVPAK